KLSETSLDFGKRELLAGELSSAQGTLAVVRDKDGNADITNLLAPPAPGSKPAAPEPRAAPWRIALARLALDGYTIRVEDHATVRPARYALTKTDLLLEKISTDRGTKGMLSVRFGINGRGSASAKGPVGINPTYAELKADVRSLDLVPLEAYVLSSFRLKLARANLSAGGTLSFREDARGKPSIRYAGQALVANALAVDPSSGLDFLRWDSFSASGMKAGYNPTFLEIARLGVGGVGCDVVVEPDGKVNLSKVLITGTPGGGEEEEAAPGDAESGAPASGEAAPAPTPTPTPAPAAASATAPPSQPPAEDKVPIRIDTLVVEKGRIGLADHFVRPNYSATLADVNGQITGLSTQEGTVAQLDLHGRLAEHSPLEISGKINPLAAAAFADVKASFRDIDLPPFTPYMGKYAGFAIARGTLTMEVQYKLQNRKLAAQNRFLVDQFELGEKVESKDATKLPVRLAVSLLKDRNGLIDLDLPIEGSLDDPKFRLGKVIWKVIGNLIGKAATAPFALIGKLFGGKEEELSSLDFAGGRSSLDET
ncbi:MAG TPA: DUF748 domain-containing protein, partial [Thermoanaerobaculia bacterium]